MNTSETKHTGLQKCPRCGTLFNCSASGKCWCYEYDVPARDLEIIEEQFDSCLCPDCLKTFVRTT